MNKGLGALILSLSAVTSVPAAAVSDCHAVFDAGSSGTRLYLYQENGGQWLTHEGPKVGALADPVREIRGKRWNDANAVTDEVVTALAALRQDGPADDDGKLEWSGFDWQQHCALRSVSVYATAGMRIAEQENRQRSAALWQMLNHKLVAEVGPGVKVDTRTISGFEEGLYAWLALRAERDSNNYGIAEMGGASTQVTFPCKDCDDSDNAVRTVLVEGTPVKIYSYSFLGLGQDEAPKTLGFPASCAYKIGSHEPDWKPESCSARIPLADRKGIKDPYNYRGAHKGTHNTPPLNRGQQQNWVLTGAFSYMSPSDIETCCVTGGSCYNQQSSCFTAIYRLKYLDTLTIPANSVKADVSWTAGANLCGATDCLSAAKKPICRWSDQGCL